MDKLSILSGHLLEAAFISYLFGIVLFTWSAAKRRHGVTERIAWGVTAAGWIAQLGFFILRWVYSGHAPVSNLFEFMTFFGMMLILVLLIVYRFYRYQLLAVMALVISILIIGCAAMFPREVAPLVPSLQSHWLYIHVTTAALGEAVLAVSFFAGFLYILHETDQEKPDRRVWLIEAIIALILSVAGYMLLAILFRTFGYTATVMTADASIIYQLPPFFVPIDMVSSPFPFKVSVPDWMRGENAALKLNTIFLSLLSGCVLYILIRFFTRKRIGAALQPFVQRMPKDMLDDIGYRSVAVGFPIFTLGALIFAMIWAQQAWDRFWGWDPKEVWALITWLFYAAYLHIRMLRGWQGIRSAWLAVIGFCIIMFNLLAVNLLIVGLHAYA
ncbi:c-type cytochrome biogenesis protein CcsB [Terribacillus saccharophilus]|uniref:C-type cytochrome biogenesis protein CcsB n=1 Tax=Terribacillus saccharophilus TaxID=361277 RepID=A0A268HFG1_9BACI|nr:c-type cytochrome biogenesis protein CcsB [Terribacillus saccharophilus]PAE08622.1 c-type cytochrome biogenesis protein CcsB [Terribacillus saccharophilus]